MIDVYPQSSHQQASENWLVLAERVAQISALDSYVGHCLFVSLSKSPNPAHRYAAVIAIPDVMTGEFKDAAETQESLERFHQEVHPDVFAAFQMAFESTLPYPRRPIPNGRQHRQALDTRGHKHRTGSSRRNVVT